MKYKENICGIQESKKQFVIILTTNLPIKHFVVIGFNMHAYYMGPHISMREGGR